MSDDLIRRSDAIKALNREKSDWNCDYNVPIDNCIKRLNKVKPADRPQGKWKVRGNPKRNLWECSLCRCTIYSESESDRNEFHKWCGRCGADMRGKDDEVR